MAEEQTQSRLTDADVQGFMQKIEAGGQELTPADEIVRERLLAQAEEAAGDDTAGFAAIDNTPVRRTILHEYARFGGLS